LGKSRSHSSAHFSCHLCLPFAKMALMNTNLKIFGMLLIATLFFNTAMNMMANNIEDYESVALPPKKQPKLESSHSLISVDAKSRSSWILVDFSSGKTHQISDLENERPLLSQLDWDLGFQRTKIMANGGATNPKGQVGIINLGQVPFDEVQGLPDMEFVEDAKAWGNIVNKSIVDWYIYRTRTHNIESKKNVYVLRTAQGHTKMRIFNYYCGRSEQECKTAMCSRLEAACYTIEFVNILKGDKAFPLPVPPVQQTAQVTH